MRLYFAHNFNKRLAYRTIELALEHQLGIELINPFYDVEGREKEMADLDQRDVDDKFRQQQFGDDKTVKLADVSPREIVDRDLGLIAGADGLLTIVEEPSFGTTIEICNAVLMRKPVHFISANYYYHPWIQVYATRRYKTVAEFVSWCNEYGDVCDAPDTSAY